MPEKDKEKELVKGLIRGDAASFDGLYNLYCQKVYSFSYRYLQNVQDAEGVVQETFITLWDQREKLGEIKNLNAWLFTVTFNLIRKHFRSMETSRRNLEVIAMTSLFESSPTLSTVEYDDLMEKAEEVIERLPRRQKEVLLLNIREGLNSSEISEKLKIHKRTVENHLSSARAFLRKVFRDEHLIPGLLFWLLS
jgi:RNA polymerase sigma-70 factor (ECF subfamily)